MKKTQLFLILILSISSTLFADNSLHLLTDDECHAAVNEEKTTSGIISKQLKDGVPYGEETCGYLYQGLYTSLYWIQGTKGICEITAGDFDNLNASKSDGKDLEAECDSGNLNIITLHPMPDKEGQLHSEKRETPNNCHKVKSKDGSDLLICDCDDCGKQEAKDGIHPKAYHCEVHPDPETGKDALFCGYDDTANWNAIPPPPKRHDPSKDGHI